MARAAQIFRGMAAGLGVAVLGLGGYLGWLRISGNHHTVIAGQLYRASQVTPGDLAAYRAEVGLAAVLNLRGAAPGAAWYDAEAAEAAALGVVQADFAMSAGTALTLAEAAQLVELMRSLPKPLLIHCKHGSDRTGLASALYLGAIAGQDEATAEGQLSLRYGHFAVPVLSAAWPMYATWERLEPLMGFQDS